MNADEPGSLLEALLKFKVSPCMHNVIIIDMCVNYDDVWGMFIVAMACHD